MAWTEKRESWVTALAAADARARAGEYLKANVGAAKAYADGVEAEGGSQTTAILLGTGLMSQNKLPMRARVSFGAAPAGTAVEVYLGDTYALKFAGLLGIRKYEKRFAELIAGLRGVLP